jgi:hypothetical protein
VGAKPVWLTQRPSRWRYVHTHNLAKASKSNRHATSWRHVRMGGKWLELGDEVAAPAQHGYRSHLQNRDEGGHNAQKCPMP